MPKTRQHETEITLPAAPEDVWRAITDPAAVTTWYAPEARIDGRVGGDYIVSWGPGMEGSAKIEAWEPNQLLRTRTERTLPGAEPVSMAIEMTIESDKGETKLRLVHSGFLETEAWDREFESTRQGWALMLRILRYGLRTDPHFTGAQRWVYVSTAMPIAEVWKALTGEFAGVPFEHTDEPNGFAAPWNEMGAGLVSVELAQRGGKTGISVIVSLLGDAAGNIDRAGEYWNAKLTALTPALANAAELQ